MREILFRGKRIDNGEWVYGSLILWRDGSASIDDGSTESPMYSVIPETVGQYTGLCDKDGKKIFEGDILTGLFRFGLSVNSFCDFRNGSFGTAYVRSNYEHFKAFTSYYNVDFEVVGNIHDNPELLNEE